MTDKIINTFQQRRQLEQAFANLAQTNHDAELAQAARQIVHTFPADLVLAALVKHLDTLNGQIRGGLGHIAGLLPAESVLPALRNAVANRHNSPQTRVTAASIVERFLGVDLPGALLSDLSDANDVAHQSLREALDESRRNRHVLLEYVTQMEAHGEDVAFMVMGMLERTPVAEQVELLRLIAQDKRPRVAKEAIIRLEQLTATEAGAAALRALYTLQFGLTAELSSQVERTMRKLQFSGKRYTPLPTENWRALLGIAEPNGSQPIWLVRMPETPNGFGAILGFVINLAAGVLQFFASETLETRLLPTQHPIGQLTMVTTDRGDLIPMLEAPFEIGRWLVTTALDLQRRNAPEQPLNSEFRLYNDLFWQFPAASVDPHFAAYFQEDELDKSAAATSAVDQAGLMAAAEHLFAHPAMQHWAIQGRALLLLMQRKTEPRPALPVNEIVAMMLKEMTRWPEAKNLVEALARGLRTQAAWFHIAGETERARHAQHLATQMQTLPITQNPVLARMLALGIGLPSGGTVPASKV